MQQLNFGSEYIDVTTLAGDRLTAAQMSLWSDRAGTGGAGADTTESIIDGCLAFGRQRGVTAAGEPGLRSGDSFSEMYDRFAGCTPLAERLQVVARVASRAGAGEGTALSLIPFIWSDPEPQVAHTAAMESALLVTPKGDNPLTGAETLLSFASFTSLENVRAGILGGLVLLGDRRVNRLLRDSWRMLGPAGRSTLMNAWSGYALAAHVEFLIDWLEDAPEYDFGGIVSALAAIPARANHQLVLDIERSFPVNGAGGTEPALTVREVWSIEQYGAVIAPRLIDLYRRESTPRVLHYAMEAWGIDW